MLLAVAPVVSLPALTRVPVDDLGGILVVATTINGKGPFHFVLDTGAGITVIVPKLAKELNLQPTGSDFATGVGGPTQVPLISLERVGVGGAQQENVATAIIPLPASVTYQGSYGEIDGIIGFSFLKSYAVTLDIAHKTASFSSTAFAPPAGVLALPFELAEHAIPTVQAAVNGASGRFEIDSGNNGPMALTEAFADAHGVVAAYRAARASAFAGVGGTVNTKLIRIASLSIGNTSLHAVASDVSPAKASVFQRDGLDGALGYDVLRRFVITLDYPRTRLFLQANADFDAFEPRVGTGATIQRTAAGDFLIIGVAQDSPAGRAGLVPGETIVAIGGRPAAQLSQGTYHELLGTTPGKRITLTLLSKDGARRDVVVSLVDLLPPPT